MEVVQSALWPIALAGVVGLIIGMAVTFSWFGDRTARNAAPIVSPESVPVPLEAVVDPRIVSPRSAPNESAISPPVAPAAPSANAPAAAPAKSPHKQEAATPSRGNIATGRLLVRTVPSGARVLLDGKDVGATPSNLNALTSGAHMVRVLQPGYESEERRVIITPGPAAVLIVDMAPVDGSGSRGRASDDRFASPLIIESRPPGAAVYLNGRRMGATPLTLESVPVGSHALRLELDGYRRWTAAVRVAPGQRNRVTASLDH